MMKIIRKSSTPKRLAFLLSFALFSQVFCTNTFASTPTEKLDECTAVCSSVGQDHIAGNAGTQKSSQKEVVANNAPVFALSVNAKSLIGNDKLLNSETETNSVLNNKSIPETENEVCDNAVEYYDTIYCTYSDAINEIEFEKSTLLEEITTPGSLDTGDIGTGDVVTPDEVTSGASSIIGTDNTNSDDETETTTSDGDSSENATSSDEVTQTTTQKGDSSGKASLGGGSSSRKAQKNNDPDKSSTPDKRRSDDDGAHWPDQKSTDTPDALKDESNNDNYVTDDNGKDYADDDNGNDDSSLTADDKKGTDTDTTENDRYSQSTDRSSVNILPQTGSAADTMTITLCGLIFIAFGTILIRKIKKA